MIENMAPQADGDLINFVISHSPLLPSMTVFFPGMPDEQVATYPIAAMQYAVTGTNVTFGMPPAQGRTPWCRYFYNDVPQPPAIAIHLMPDSLRNFWSDSLNGRFTLREPPLTDSSFNNWTDQAALRLLPQRIPLTLSDDLNNCTDRIQTNRLMFALPDSLSNWADATKTNRLTCALADNLSNWADQATVVKL